MEISPWPSAAILQSSERRSIRPALSGADRASTSAALGGRAQIRSQELEPLNAGCCSACPMSRGSLVGRVGEWKISVRLWLAVRDNLSQERRTSLVSDREGAIRPQIEDEEFAATAAPCRGRWDETTWSKWIRSIKDARAGTASAVPAFEAILPGRIAGRN